MDKPRRTSRKMSRKDKEWKKAHSFDSHRERTVAGQDFKLLRIDGHAHLLEHYRKAERQQMSKRRTKLLEKTAQLQRLQDEQGFDGVPRLTCSGEVTCGIDSTASKDSAEQTPR